MVGMNKGGEQMADLAKCRVIVVSNSINFSNYVQNNLAMDPKFLVSSTSNLLTAQTSILKNVKNVLIIDTEGQPLTANFLKMLLENNNVFIILAVKTMSQHFELLKSGVKDMVLKPASLTNFWMTDIKNRIAQFTSIGRNLTFRDLHDTVDSSSVIIAMAASTGGTEALQVVLSALPEKVPPIVIVQHMPAVFTRLYAERINKLCKLEVLEAKNGDYLKKGTALIAPGDFHMSLVKRDSKLAVECSQAQPKLHGVRPAADILFNSIAPIMGKNVIGVILTGMGNDGAAGLLEMKRRGARNIGQDKATSIVYGMPKVAFDIGAIDIQAPLDKIPNIIMNMI